MLKQNADILLDVCTHYEQLFAKDQTHKDLPALKNQILFLLTGIQKQVEEEQRAT